MPQSSGCVSAEHVRAMWGCPSEGTCADFCIQIWKSGRRAPVPRPASYFACQEISNAQPDVCISPAHQSSGAAVVIRCLMFEACSIFNP